MVYQGDKTLTETFFKTSGRLNRLRYFKRSLVIALVISVLTCIVELVFNEMSDLNNILSKAIVILMLVPIYCIDVRRLHDMNKDATLAKINFVLGLIGIFIIEPDFTNMSIAGIVISVVTSIISLYMLFAPGTNGSNQYGSDPLK